MEGIATLSPGVVDLMIAGAIAVGAAWGFRRGGIRLAGPFAVIAGFAILKQSYPEIIAAFRTQPRLPTMMVVKLGTLAGFMLYGLLARFLHRAVHLTGLGLFNRLGGVAFGALTAVIFAGGALWFGRELASVEIDRLLIESQLARAVYQLFALLALIAEYLFRA